MSSVVLLRTLVLMEFAERYRLEKLTFLIEVVEFPDRFQADAVSAASAEIRSRNPSQSDLLPAAREVWTREINRYLQSFSVFKGELKLPESRYLNEEEMRLLFRTCFITHKNVFDARIPDGWLYALGGL